MTEVSEDFKNLELDYHIFKDVKYYITGEVEENVILPQFRLNSLRIL